MSGQQGRGTSARRLALVAAVVTVACALVFLIGTPAPPNDYETGVGGVAVRPYLVPELSVGVLLLGLLSALVLAVAYPVHLAGPSPRGRQVAGLAGTVLGCLAAFFVAVGCAWYYPSVGGPVPGTDPSRVGLSYGFTQTHEIEFERHHLLLMTPVSVVHSDYVPHSP